MGTFSGRQLTTMFCAIVLVVLVPAGAWAAVSFTNVSITDPGGVNRAKVDATGALSVGDGSGPLTVDGTVIAKSVLPAKPIVIVSSSVTPFGTVIYGPQTKPFGITSVTVMNSCPDPVFFELDSFTSAPASFVVQNALIPALATVELTFPTPLVTTPPSGGNASLVAKGSAGCIVVSGVGVQS